MKECLIFSQVSEAAPGMNLSDNFHEVIRNARKQRRLTQARLSEKAGVSRKTIGRLESGRHPALETLERVNEHLGLTLKDLAENYESLNIAAESDRSEQIFDIGQGIRDRRRQLKISLKTLSQETGLSEPTLSRLERGRSLRSRVFKDNPEYADLPFEDRLVLVDHPYLRDFLKGGS